MCRPNSIKAEYSLQLYQAPIPYIISRYIEKLEGWQDLSRQEIPQGAKIAAICSCISESYRIPKLFSNILEKEFMLWLMRLKFK